MAIDDCPVEIERPTNTSPVSEQIQRFDTGEHALLGDSEALVAINGVNLSEGQLIAIGDFYATYDDLKRAPRTELIALKALVDRAALADRGVPGAQPVTTEEWNDATDGRYLTLAKSNDSHFAPDASTPEGHGGGDHKSQWEGYHRQALGIARQAGAAGEGLPPEALAINAFGAHYLTDAFSVGHILSKSDISARARQAWEAEPTTGWIFKENTFSQGVAARVFANAAVRRKLAGKQLRLIAWDTIDATRFSEFLWQTESEEPDLFYNMFAKHVHDELNETIVGSGDASGGVEVANERGDQWVLAGDETLALSPETFAIASAAVDEAARNLATVHSSASTGGPRSEPAENRAADEQAAFERVWAYVPRVTEAGRERLEGVVSASTNPSDPSTIQGIAALFIREMDTLIVELEKVRRLRDTPPMPDLPSDYMMF